MADVKVLIKGYTSEESGEEKTCATITLVKDEDIVDFLIGLLFESTRFLTRSDKVNGMLI